MKKKKNKEEIKAALLKIYKLARPFLAAIFAVFGCVLKFAMVGYSFLAYMCFGIAFIFLAFILLEYTSKKFEFVSKEIHTVLKFIAIGVAGVFVLTLFVLLYGSSSAEDTTADYAILMGAGVNGTEPSRSLSDRLNAALEYLEENPEVVCIVSGGQGEKEDITEAECMRIWLEEHGIASERIVEEAKAENTYQNLYNSFAIICDLEGLNMEEELAEAEEDEDGAAEDELKIAVITSEYHLMRTKFVADTIGFSTINVAADTTGTLMTINQYSREVFAIWKTMLLGEK